MNARPPKSVRDAVVTKLYKQFDALLWEQLSSRDKSTAYTQFVDDAEIGGALGTYMDPGKIRVWIKDGPAKEYIRAIEGVGNYAQFTERRYPDTAQTVESVLGSGWVPVDGSTAEKPMRCLATSPSGERRFLVWGAASSLKELVWHVLLHRTAPSHAAPVLVVTRPSMAPLQTADRKLAEQLCQMIGAEFKTVERLAKVQTQ